MSKNEYCHFHSQIYDEMIIFGFCYHLLIIYIYIKEMKVLLVFTSFVNFPVDSVLFK